MRSLEQALQDHELIVLRVIGEWWELDLTGADKAACVQAVETALLNLDLVQELNFLPPEEAAAIQALVAENGRAPVAAFSRQHGEVRPMGPGRMEREEPWLDPISPAEALWYRGFLYRGFDETAEGMMEFFYLPDELLAQFPRPEKTLVVAETAVPALTPVTPPQKWETAVTQAVDDLTTMLALAQTTSLSGIDWPRYLLDASPPRRSLLFTMAREMNWLRQSDEGLRPTRAALGWLKESREAQLRALADAWSASGWNELRRTPGLICEGEGWENDPILARTAVLDALPRQPEWVAVNDLVNHIHATNPDFQRPDGNYDTWYIRDETSGDFLTGFENWPLVEGRLIRFLLAGPLTWLGLVELGGDAFRLTARALDWLQDTPPPPDAVRAPLVVGADGLLVVPHNSDRYVRFQVMRIAEAEPVSVTRPYQYRLTPQSLKKAGMQGIAPERILQFLQDASERPLPAGIQRAIHRWAERGCKGISP
ncbi:MAG: helicase-associated domain-containing protein, partial [Anaerolineae bacterium]